MSTVDATLLLVTNEECPHGFTRPRVEQVADGVEWVTIQAHARFYLYTTIYYIDLCWPRADSVHHELMAVWEGKQTIADATQRLKLLGYDILYRSSDGVGRKFAQEQGLV